MILKFEHLLFGCNATSA